MKLIYIAGPYRADSEFKVEMNCRDAESAALLVWRLGGCALCPHKNTRNFGGALDDEVWLEGDIEMMIRCDGVLMTRRWESSSGAQNEHDVAIRQCIPIAYLPDADTINVSMFAWLRSWMDTLPNRDDRVANKGQA